MVEINAVRYIKELIESDPQLAAIVGAFFVVLGLAQYFLGPDDDWVETRREKYLLELHEILSIFGGYAKVTKEGPGEYVYSVKVGEEELEEILYSGGYHRNVIAAKKERIKPDGEKELSLNSWVHRPSLMADMQSHATNYPGHKEGEVDIYHHYETSWVSHPIEHYFSVKQYDGDPEGHLEEALEMADVEYYRDEEWVNEFSSE